MKQNSTRARCRRVLRRKLRSPHPERATGRFPRKLTDRDEWICQTVPWGLVHALQEHGPHTP